MSLVIASSTPVPKVGGRRRLKARYPRRVLLSTWSASQAFNGGFTAASACTITNASASALTVGRQGATDPVLKVNSATASVATGIEITGAAAAGGVAIAAISSGTNENLKDRKSVV